MTLDTCHVAVTLSLWKKKKAYSYNKVDKNLFETEFIASKSLRKCKDLIIQKICKGNTLNIERTKYLKGIKSPLSKIYATSN